VDRSQELGGAAPEMLRTALEHGELVIHPPGDVGQRASQVRTYQFQTGMAVEQAAAVAVETNCRRFMVGCGVSEPTESHNPSEVKRQPGGLPVRPQRHQADGSRLCGASASQASRSSSIRANVPGGIRPGNHMARGF
jgi:hypothetical protein